MIKAVRHWLSTHYNWLLVFDNAQNFKSLSNYLPNQSTGHILVTSLNPSWREICIELKEVEGWERDESITFLRQRTGIKDPAGAHDLANALHDSPLALEVAGAYIESTVLNISNYLQLFNTQPKLLFKAAGPSGHENSIHKTFVLSIEAAKKIQPLSLDMVNFCALVAADAIPQLLIRSCCEKLQQEGKTLDDMDFNSARQALIQYSLIKIDGDNFSIHFLVQGVAQEIMDKMRYREAIIKALSELFPARNEGKKNYWQKCESLLPHAKKVIADVDNECFLWQEISLLQSSMALYYLKRAAYEDAQSWAKRALDIREKYRADYPLAVAESLICLGKVLYGKSQYSDAEKLFREALGIREKKLGVDHPDVAECLDRLGFALHAQWKTEEWETLFHRAKDIRERLSGDNRLDVAMSLNNLGFLLHAMGRYVEGERWLREALEIREAKLNPDHEDVARSLHILADLLREQEKYKEAKELFLRALSIRKSVSGEDHPSVAQTLNDLGMVFYGQGKFDKGEELLRRALEIKDNKLGRDHPITATSLNNLGLLLCAQNKNAEAETLLHEAKEIRVKKFGEDHPKTATSLNDLGLVLQSQHKFSEAEPLFRHALKIREKMLGHNHPKTIVCRKNLRLLIRKMQ